MTAKSKRRKKSKTSFNKGNFLFVLAFFLIFSVGLVLISRQFADAYRAKSNYEKQQAEFTLNKEKEKELLQDRQDIKNPVLFEEVARKNGYRMENETVVSVTRPITEEDKWK